MNEPTHALVVAAGRGARAGAGLPKQFRPIGGQPILARTIRMLLEIPDVATVTPVIHADDRTLFDEAAAVLPAALAARLHAPTFGGETRQDSVYAGLEALCERIGGAAGIVLIHDGARPFASAALVRRAIEEARARGAAIPGCSVFDTVKEVGEGGRIVASPDRDRLKAVQTPQAFRFDLILEAHRRARRDDRRDLTDDAAVAQHAGHDVYVFEGETTNLKITTIADLQRSEARILADLPDIRTGQGFDVHAFTDGDHVTLGGVRIPHGRALTGHSDADVVLHALTDAVLGAIGDGDIGVHFPPSEARWKGAASSMFLRYAVERVRERGGMVAHLNATVVCEAPKVGPHREAMRASIAAAAGIDVGRVAITATTSERMGFTGRGEGIVAWGLATVRLPVSA